MRKCVFDRPLAVSVNEARLEHLASLGLDLEGETVLEVGCGVGKLTHFFRERSCFVVSVDGRQINIDEFIRRHPRWRRQACVVDLRRIEDYACFGFPWNVVFAYSVLQHMSPETLPRVIAELASRCGQLMLISQLVHHTDDGQVHPHDDVDAVNQSLDGKGNRAARDWMMAELRKHFGYVYLSVKQPNYNAFKTRWPSGGVNCRAVFVASRSKLGLPTLTEELLTEQERLG